MQQFTVERLLVDTFARRTILLWIPDIVPNWSFSFIWAHISLLFMEQEALEERFNAARFSDLNFSILDMSMK
jgi:hypothetical protein